MESSQNSFPNELSREEYELEQCPFAGDWEYDELTWSVYDDTKTDEKPEEDNIYYSDDSSYPDDEQVKGADEESIVDEENVQDLVEYVHFGKGLELDGEKWIWEEDVDFWSEMSR